MVPLTFVILALAVFRISRLAVTDRILDRPRDWLFTRFPSSETVFAERQPGMFWSEEYEGWMPVEPSWLGELLSCVWCTSFWVAVTAVVLWWACPDVIWWVALPFALSAVAGLLDSWT